MQREKAFKVLLWNQCNVLVHTGAEIWQQAVHMNRPNLVRKQVARREAIELHRVSWRDSSMPWNEWIRMPQGKQQKWEIYLFFYLSFKVKQVGEGEKKKKLNLLRSDRSCIDNLQNPNTAHSRDQGEWSKALQGINRRERKEEAGGEWISPPKKKKKNPL